MRKKTGKKQKKFSKKGNFRLIKFNNKYLKLVYLWRNDKLVIRNSLSKKKISYENHKLWIKNKLKVKSNKIFIFLKNEDPIGTCSIIKDKNYFYFNYLIEKNSRKKGYSKIMLKRFIERLKRLKIKQKIIAIVIKSNQLSFKLLSNLGFEFISRKDSYYILKLKT